MKFWFYRTCFVFLSLIVSNSAFADTWYVRADGGTRYSANASAGQCDGKADVAYPGSGVNQHCAFNDYRFLWDDQTYGNNGWVIAGGDTVILDNTKQWRVGFDQAGSNDPWCFGGNGPFSCTNPTIPAGTATQHTRILGRNYAACTTPSGQADPNRMTQIFGGHGVYTALNLSGADYVDVGCIEVTRHSSCMVHGLPVYGSYCRSSFPLDDYDSQGITTSSATHDLLLQDMYIHGHVDSGIKGAISGAVTANRVAIAFNGSSGWNFDDGSSDRPPAGTSLKLKYVSVIGNGCIQQYPSVDPFPALVCYDQQSAGYGDGIGTASSFGMSVSIDYSLFAYNTQDGVDLGHIDSGTNTLSITNSLAYGNEGGQFKWGPNFQNATFENNLVLANCTRMSARLPGAPSNYNQYLSNFCRALDGVSFNFRQGGQLTMANNTVVNYAPTTFDVQCSDSSCSQSQWIFENNLVRGYDDPANYGMGAQEGGPGLFYVPQTLGTVTRANNIFYGIRGSCQANVPTNAANGYTTGESCLDPMFLNEPASFATESTLDGYNFQLDPSSPAIGAGVAVAGLTTDFEGASRQSPTSLGALEAGSQARSTDPPAWPADPHANAPAATTPAAPSGPASTATSLTVGNVASLLQSTTFTAQVKPLTGGGVPQGTVTLYFATYAIATASLDATGTATWTFPAYLQKLGLVAVYGGSSDFLTSTSNLLTTNLTASLLF